MCLPLGQLHQQTFSCGEQYIRFENSIRGQEVFLVATIRPGHVHDDFFEIFLFCDAARRSFAKSVHVVVPHFGYTRQDKVHRPREPISMKLCADLLVRSGADHLITLDLHAAQTQGFFDVPVDNICAQRFLAGKLLEMGLPKNPVVTTVDAGGVKAARAFAAALGGLPLAVLHKNRPAANKSVTTHVMGSVEGATPILFDDMVDTAGSVCGAKQALEQAGALPGAWLVATHGVCSGPASKRLADANFARIVLTNTLPLAPEIAQNPAVHCLDTAPLLAEVIGNVMHGRSVSEAG